MPSPGPHDLARALPRDAFVKVFASPFLVVTDTGDDEPPSSFETVDAAHAPKTLPSKGGVEVHPIAKAKGNPYKDRVSVGRAPNCDVVLRYASISKLHGYFRARTEGEGMEFVDVGSQIGSRVNGRPLEANKAVPVSTGALLLLGRVAARIVDAGTVWDLLKAQERIDSPKSSRPSGTP